MNFHHIFIIISIMMIFLLGPTYLIGPGASFPPMVKFILVTIAAWTAGAGLVRLVSRGGHGENFVWKPLPKDWGKRRELDTVEIWACYIASFVVTFFIAYIWSGTY